MLSPCRRRSQSPEVRLSARSIPFGHLDTIFLDAGNTLVHWDHAFVAECAAALGVSLDPAAIARAEAAARPRLDRLLATGRSTEASDTLAAALECMLDAGLRAALGPNGRPTFVARLAAALRRPGASDRLWSRVPAGVPESLAKLRAAGLTLVVVSNSDGSIERKLREAGLRELLDQVVDSALVGAEKPDPAIFRHALACCGSVPERTLHVGDLHAIDVVGAQRAGLHAVLLDPYGDWSEKACAKLPNVGALATAILEAKGR